MSVKKYTDLEKERIYLRDAIPLKTPFSIQVEVTNYCNYDCPFCIHSKEGWIEGYTGKYMHMDFELFKKLVNDIKEFPEKLKTFRLFLLGEPLIAPDLINELDYCFEMDISERVEITTNATLLNIELSTKILDIVAKHRNAKLYMRYSIETINQERNESLTGNKIKVSDICNNVAVFQQIRDEKGLNKKVSTFAKMFATGTEEDDLFKRMYEGNVDEVGFEYVSNLTNTEINLADGYKESIKAPVATNMPLVCHYPFIFMAVRADGMIRTCCIDYTMDTIVGDLKKNSLKEIWNGIELKRFRKMHLDGNRSRITACKNCQCLSTKEADIIDGIPSSLLD